jgi:hypothetical protein
MPNVMSNGNGGGNGIINGGGGDIISISQSILLTQLSGS